VCGVRLTLSANYFRPVGAFSCGDVGCQGLTPLAIDDRPVGASCVWDAWFQGLPPLAIDFRRFAAGWRLRHIDPATGYPGACYVAS
jgi:hypothetical protein